jgi:hypothetical protein
MNPLDPYPSPEVRDAELVRLVARMGGEVRRYGSSVEGRPLLAGRIPAVNTLPSPPRVLVAANIHGPEYVSGAVALGFLAGGELAALRARAEVWVIPCLNPDAYARVWDRQGRGEIRELRPNARGVDLNRNFPLPPGKRRARLPGAGSTDPRSATFVGEAPLSEPETAALGALCAEVSFHAATSGHSFMGTIIPAHVEDQASFASYRELCRAFAAAQPRARYRRLSSRRLDTFTGELEDHLHHAAATWAACVETFPLSATLRQHLRAPSLFWRFNPHDPAPWVGNDVPAVAAFLAAALSRPRPPLA